MNNNQKIVIFPIYFNQAPIFQNEIFKPIQAGCALNEIYLEEGILTDNTGDNISSKNPYYGELTATYWIWKNYLKENPNIEYIGFCHYRRFFDFISKKATPNSFELTDYNIFTKNFSDNYKQEIIEQAVKGYDVILPKPMKTANTSVYEYYVSFHPKEIIDKFIEIVKSDYPDYTDCMENFLNGHEMCLALNFVMRKDLFMNWCDWIFDILFKIEKTTDLTKYKTYNEIRSQAFVAERFFNVWLKYNIQKYNLKIKELNAYLLDDLNPKVYPFLLGKLYIDNKRIIFNILGIKFFHWRKKQKESLQIL